MAADPDEIVRRGDQLLANRRNFDTLYQDAAEYVMPGKANITSQPAPGQRQGTRVFDSSAIRGGNLLSATMAGSLTSSALPWFSMRLRDDALNEQEEVRQYLEQCETRLYRAYRQSKFYAATHECYYDLNLGTACLFMDERKPARGGFGGFFFKAIPYGEYAIDEGPEGDVDTLYRAYRMSAKACVQKWGEGKVGERVRSKYRDTPYETIDLLHAVYPRVDRNPRSKANRHLPFASCVVIKEDKLLVEEGGYHEFPFAVPRWALTSGELYGRGPALTGYGDIRSLNRAMELELRAGAKALGPSWLTTDDGLVGTLDMRPDAVNAVEAPDGDVRKAMMPLNGGTNWTAAEILNRKLENAILQGFYYDQVQPLGTDRIERTATEIERRWEVMRRILGPTLARLEHEFLNAIVERTFALGFRGGLFPEPPAILRGQNIDVEYEGPLSRSQKSLRVTGLREYWMLAGAVIAAKRELMDLHDWPAILRDQADISGLPKTYLVSAERWTELEAMHREQAAAQARMQQFAVATQGAGRAAPAVKQLNEMMAGSPNGAAA